MACTYLMYQGGTYTRLDTNSLVHFEGPIRMTWYIIIPPPLYYMSFHVNLLNTAVCLSMFSRLHIATIITSVYLFVKHPSCKKCALFYLSQTNNCVLLHDVFDGISASEEDSFSK